MSGNIGVRLQIGDHGLNGDGFLRFVPHIIISNMGHCGVTDLGLSGQLSFRDGCHANDVHAPLTKHVGFSFGTEPGPLYGDVSPPFVDGGACFSHRLVEPFGKSRTERLCKTNMGNQSSLEKTH